MLWCITCECWVKISFASEWIFWLIFPQLAPSISFLHFSAKSPINLQDVCLKQLGYKLYPFSSNVTIRLHQYKIPNFWITCNQKIQWFRSLTRTASMQVLSWKSLPLLNFVRHSGYHCRVQKHCRTHTKCSDLLLLWNPHLYCACLEPG